MQQRSELRFPKPGKATAGLMISIGVIWLLFAIGINWVGAGADVFSYLAGDTRAVLGGQIWRLVSANLITAFKSPGHPLMVCLLLYFFATPMEELWGSRRLLMFLLGSGAMAFSVQVLVDLLIPQLAVNTWYGGMCMAEACAVAWAFANRKQTVYLFFVLPIKPMWMVGFLVAWAILNNIIAANPDPEGTIAPLASFVVGWLLCDVGPLRRLYLKVKLRRLQSEVSSLTRRRQRSSRRKNGPDLRVIKGGNDDDPKMLH